MLLKTSKFLQKIITISLLSISITNADNVKNVTNIENESNSMNVSYYRMDTDELEKEVEKLSLTGTLSFEMGVELIKRWTNKY